jgi:hypothetical protein
MLASAARYAWIAAVMERKKKQGNLGQNRLW